MGLSVPAVEKNRIWKMLKVAHDKNHLVGIERMWTELIENGSGCGNIYIMTRV